MTQCHREMFEDRDAGEPLFLSPFIRDGQLTEGRNASQVLVEGMRSSHAGFMTIDEKALGHDHPEVAWLGLIKIWASRYG